MSDKSTGSPVISRKFTIPRSKMPTISRSQSKMIDGKSNGPEAILKCKITDFYCIFAQICNISLGNIVWIFIVSECRLIFEGIMKWKMTSCLPSLYNSSYLLLAFIHLSFRAIQSAVSRKVCVLPRIVNCLREYEKWGENFRHFWYLCER